MEAGPNLTPPPGRLSPASSPGGATAQKAGASPPPGPRTLDLRRLVRRGSAPSAQTAEAWRPGLSESDCGPVPSDETLAFSAGGCSASPRVAAPDPGILVPRAGRASLTLRNTIHSHSLPSRVGSAFFYLRATSLCSHPVTALTHSVNSQFRRAHYTRDRLSKGISKECA